MGTKMQDITDIINYILYLKNKCGLSISIHAAEGDDLIVNSDLINFNIHDNSYCIYIKTQPGAQERCVNQQRKVLSKCQNGMFCGTCYAGVREYVYPILNAGETVGFISVSGCRAETPEIYWEAMAKKFAAPYEKVQKMYGCLKEELPPKGETDTLLIPLCRMLELAYLKYEKGNLKKSLVDEVQLYVKRHHTQNITLEDVGDYLSCSCSYISHSFKKQTGLSFREYLTSIRLENAKLLLRCSDLTVTEIAFSVGFDNSNYFSNVFKKCVGMSPMAYRRSVR